MADLVKRKRIYGKLEVGVWNDRRFLELSAPEPNGQTLWLHLLSSPRRTNLPGLIVGRPAVIADDLRWPVERLRELFAELFAKRFAKGNLEIGVIFLERALFHSDGTPRETSRPANGNVVKSWGKYWPNVPDCQISRDYLAELKRFVEPLGEPFAKAFSDSFPEPLTEPLGEPLGEQYGDPLYTRHKAQGTRHKDPPDSAEGIGPSIEGVALAERLRDYVLTANPSAACSQTFPRVKWAKAIDGLLLPKGKKPARYSVAQLTYAIDWLGGEQFGPGSEASFVVESAASFVKKLDSIAANLVSQAKRGAGGERTSELDAEIAAAEAEEA
jgi:hypothetical protein